MELVIKHLENELKKEEQEIQYTKIMEGFRDTEMEVITNRNPYNPEYYRQIEKAIKILSLKRWETH
jgi:hypothetical protein